MMTLVRELCLVALYSAAAAQCSSPRTLSSNHMSVAVGRVPLKVKVRIALYGLETHQRATERHLPYGITQCYLPSDTGERAPP